MNWITEFLLLLEESAVEGVSGGIIEEFEAVEDLDGASSLNTDDATVDTWLSAVVVVVVSGGGGGGVVHLRFYTSVVIRYVYYHQWMKLERQSTARRRRHCSPFFFLFTVCCFYYMKLRATERRTKIGIDESENLMPFKVLMKSFHFFIFLSLSFIKLHTHT